MNGTWGKQCELGPKMISFASTHLQKSQSKRECAIMRLCLNLSLLLSMTQIYPDQIHQQGHGNGSMLGWVSTGILLAWWKPLPTRGQLIKKLFVILHWIDHLFPRILFLIIYSLHASSWWKETFISFCIYCIGKQKHSAAFPGGSLIYLLDKRLKFSTGQKN